MASGCPSAAVSAWLFARGIMVTSEAIRQWCQQFGQSYANQLRRRRPQPGDTWHLDEVLLAIGGERHDLWRAVDQDGNVLEILVQRRRDKRAAKQCFRKRLKGLAYAPRVLITDELKRYGAAKREMLPRVDHRQHKDVNNVRRLPTSRHASGSGACRGSSPRGTRSEGIDHGR